MSSKSRNASDLINVVPLTYTNDTVANQPLRPIIGDQWVVAAPDPFSIGTAPKVLMQKAETKKQPRVERVRLKKRRTPRITSPWRHKTS